MSTTAATTTTTTTTATATLLLPPIIALFGVVDIVAATVAQSEARFLRCVLSRPADELQEGAKRYGFGGLFRLCGIWVSGSGWV